MIITKEKELIPRFVVFALKTVDWAAFDSFVARANFFSIKTCPNNPMIEI
jgi:hypothetical protein